ncbi:tetratricopeptide repeat protein [Polyangium spumosum]|uniref:Tetratricopeptide repeat protein n=1 Tax=Polyangium spumosum TaxID=889282 RepID=A0A6N7PT58_9BACT|nr:tetratricopeptide repeat protein [Polyangium spumosum]MRG95163.1 tetratricopeptide repeat protein [Polyangium spumosum]
MRKARRLSALVLALSLGLAAAGCGRSFKLAMQRGDAFARAGDWDAAAAQYERATRIDPDEVEAQRRLANARRKQSEARATASREALARGELDKALFLARDAALFDPTNQDARRAYVEARAAVFAKAEALLASGHDDAALALARAARKCDPRDQAAVALEGRILDRMATRAYDRALAHLAKGKRGNALLALRDVEAARPGFRDAKQRAEELRRALEDELRFVLVIEKPAETKASGVSSRVEAELLRWSPDARARLVATTENAPPPNAHGVRIQAAFDTIARGHDVTTQARTCDYVCGQDRLPNPAYDAASREVDEAERRARASEGAARRARKLVETTRRALSMATNARERAKAQNKRTSDELHQCRLTEKDFAKCKAAEDRDDEARRARRAAEEREDEAKRELDRKEQELSDAEQDVRRQRSDWESAVSLLRRTPTTILVDRICAHNYGVELHAWSAATSLSLRAHVLGDADAVTLPPDPIRTSTTDETFRAESGRCLEIAAGDPLRIPSDADIEAALATRAVEKIRAQVFVWYEGYVQSYADDHAREKAAGRLEEANEAWVRHKLTGSGLPPLPR